MEFVAALLPRMALPCKETRAVVPARDTTLRFVVARDAFATVPRDTTLRPLVVAVPRDTVFAVARDADTLGRADAVVVVVRVAAVVAVRAVVGVAVVRAVVPRDVTARDVVAAALVPRDTVFVAVRRDVAFVLRAVALPARVAWGPATTVDVAAGAIGSANTARIDTNVEQTRNAPANKNTVPIAFLQ